MPAIINEITSRQELESVFEASFGRPVALLKHSNSCGISSHVLYQMGEINADINMIVIQEHRDLSNLAAEMTGHRHQSPQAFVLRDGKAIYHANHYGIDPKAIQDLLSAEQRS